MTHAWNLFQPRDAQDRCDLHCRGPGRQELYSVQQWSQSCLWRLCCWPGLGGECLVLVCYQFEEEERGGYGGHQWLTFKFWEWFRWGNSSGSLCVCIHVLSHACMFVRVFQALFLKNQLIFFQSDRIFFSEAWDIFFNADRSLDFHLHYMKGSLCTLLLVIYLIMKQQLSFTTMFLNTVFDVGRASWLFENLVVLLLTLWSKIW